MIQFLFVGIFFITTFPVLAHLFAYPKEAERRIASLGVFGKIIAALVLTTLSIVQRHWFDEAHALYPVRLVNSSALFYLVTIPIHETGHFLFSPFGTTLHVLGGSLLELVVPALLFVRFLYVRCTSLASIALFFVGYHMIHVGEYMSTARNHDGMVYLSLDQSPELHDWFRLFRDFGLLERDTAIAALTMNAGSVITALAIVALFVLATPLEASAPADR